MSEHFNPIGETPDGVFLKRERKEDIETRIKELELELSDNKGEID
jgi:hypothetical protein